MFVEVGPRRRARGVLTAAVLAAAWTAPATVHARDVRVGIAVGATIEAAEAMGWRDAGGRRGSDPELRVAGLRLPVRVRGDGTARTAGQRLPLPFDLVSYEGRTFAVVTLDEARYLGGVVSVEMHPDWPSEALEAQAVLARTFARKRIATRRAAGAPLDVVAGVLDQAYRWDPAVPDGIRRVVDATDDQVLLAPDGGLAEVFYHSCSGGMTAAASEIWGRDVPGLMPVDDPYSGECPDFFWRLALAPEELGGIVGLGAVAEIRILERGPSQRVTKVWLSDDRNEVTFGGSEFRSKIGADRFRSTLFEVGVGESGGAAAWTFVGSGSGHGIGLSQFGAKAMAEQGRSAREILAFYFPRYRLGEAD